MMSHTSKPVFKTNIFLSCVKDKDYSNEIIVAQNTLIRMISGETRIILPDAVHVAGPGDTIFFPRNELARVMKTHRDGLPYKSVAIYFTPEVMQQYFLKRQLKAAEPAKKAAIRMMEKHPLLDSLFNSLLPYFEMTNELPESIAEAKIDEAISIVRHTDAGLFDTLSLFENPGKIDLNEFMEKNYMFNLPLEKLGYLTGRSLTTFKRDFKKLFSTTPQRWLTRKRLELARYQIVEKNRKPVDVYLEAGFENLSHFSFAFKKEFGKNPSELKTFVSR